MGLSAPVGAQSMNEPRYNFKYIIYPKTCLGREDADTDKNGGGGQKIKILRRMLLPLQTRKRKIYSVITVWRYSEIEKVS